MLQTASKLYMVVNNAPPQFLPHPPDSTETITIILTHNFFDRLTMNWVSTALRTLLVNHIELLTCFYCLKDVCPGL